SLFPVDRVPKFLQLYIYDTEFETNNRLSIMPKLRRDILEADHKLDQRVYNKPTASQVAAIWVEGSDPIEYAKRDVIVRS
ncbi:38939_t:CDS:2, partial [Gigaspora margarita]